MIQYLKFMNKYGYIVHMYFTIQFAIMSGAMAAFSMISENSGLFISSALLGGLMSIMHAVFSYYSIRSQLMDELYEKLIGVKND